MELTIDLTRSGHRSSRRLKARLTVAISCEAVTALDPVDDCLARAPWAPGALGPATRRESSPVQGVSGPCRRARLRVCQADATRRTRDRCSNGAVCSTWNMVSAQPPSAARRQLARSAASIPQRPATSPFFPRPIRRSRPAEVARRSAALPLPHLDLRLRRPATRGLLPSHGRAFSASQDLPRPRPFPRPLDLLPELRAEPPFPALKQRTPRRRKDLTPLAGSFFT